MQSTNYIALKEWAVVCEALLTGRQSLILRKGGIQEAGGAFQPEHAEFWLFATQFHQSGEQLIPEAASLMDDVAAWQPNDQSICLPGYAIVEQVFRIETEESLPALEGLHILSERTVHDRFHYRKPGLFVMAVRVYRPPTPIVLPNSPHFAGCRSWVDLPDGIATGDLLPVRDDGEFGLEFHRISTALGDRPTL